MNAVNASSQQIRDPSAETIDLLVFEIAGIRCAIELACAREVLRAPLITPLPGAPPVVEGVVNARGELAPVFDLRARFGIPAAPLHPREFLVVAWDDERLVAFRCDRADQIATVDGDAVESPPVEQALAGVARLPDGLVLIHDLRAFLEEGERELLDRAMAEMRTEGDGV